ncbi:MAG TPA: apolipoprotein N-acyltransferase [Isosphaeraceae bacterium]|nr:apolipoprotein N-acyltransferase [Isosphaeraceae bacterium]
MDPTPRSPRPGFPPAVAGLASGILLWGAFPPADLGWLAWVALVPLFLLIRSERSPLALGLGSWLGGAVFWLLSIQWVRLTDESARLAWVVMALTLSLWWPGFLGLARLAVRRLGLPLMAAAPILWVGLEHVRAYVLTGFPWYYLAHSQHQAIPLIQVADFAGSLGISLLVALVNAWGVDLLTLPLLRPTSRGARPTRPQVIRGAVVLGLLAAALGYGAFRLGSARFRPGPRVALIQSSLIQRYKMSAGPDAILAVYRRLIDRAVGQPERPDLIVWPETSFPYGFVALDPRLDAPAFERQVRQVSPEGTTNDWLTRMHSVSSLLHSWTDKIGVPMLVGSLTYDFHRDGLSKYNSAILFEPGGRAVQSYHKLHLVPFGEYVPLIETFPWLVALTPYRGQRAPSLTFGREPIGLRLGPYRLAAAICFEDTVPQVVRRFFRASGQDRQPDILLNLSNDGWFHGSSEHDMHLAVSVFRAIENRVPLARAAHTGISALVDGNGRVLASLPKLHEDILTRVVPLDDRTSPYSASGDWLGLACLAVTIGLPPIAVAKSWLRRGFAVRETETNGTRFHATSTEDMG